MIRAILFDKDGTLYDFRKTWIPIVREAALHVAEGDTKLAGKLVIAAGYDGTAERFVPDGPIAAGNAGDIARAWVELVPARNIDELERTVNSYSATVGPRRSVPVGDLSRLFQALTAGNIQLGLATSDSEEGARLTLDVSGVRRYFRWIAGYDSGGAVKPDRAVVDEFSRAVGVEAGEIAVVGDTLHDMNMGRDAGVGLVVAVLTGAVEREILEPHADIVLPSILNLPEIIF